MTPTPAIVAAASLILLHGSMASLAEAADRVPRSRLAATATAAQPIAFLADDPEGQRIARRLLAKELSREAEYSFEAPRFQTAWVRLSASPARTLLVIHGCSPTGNCNLDGFERSKRGWRQVLFSLGQRAEILPSSHQGRRDLMVSMHGSATLSTIKTYWWRKNRYVRVSERDVSYAHPD